MICISIGNTDFGTVLEKVKSERLVELRLDLIKLSDEQIGILCSQDARIIAAFHPGKAGDEERIKKLKTAILAGADFVDIEMDADEEFLGEIVPFARGNDCRVIISYYDKKMTPVKRELEHIVKECSMSGADIVKIACLVHNEEDNARLMSLYSMGRNIIAVGLGITGRITRIAAPFAGAEFTYASLGKDVEINDGQMTVATIERIYKLIGKDLNL
jgi:3-dehydroquinate dehydratase I